MFLFFSTDVEAVQVAVSVQPLVAPFVPDVLFFFNAETFDRELLLTKCCHGYLSSSISRGTVSCLSG